jgi:hypothetical protein
LETPAAAKNALVGNGMGTAVDAARAPVPHFSKYFSRASALPFPNFCRYEEPTRRAILKVINAPATEPVVAAAA